MASADKLIEKIGADAQADAEKYWKESELKKSETRDKLLREIDRRKVEIDEMAKKAGVEKRKRMAAVYDLEYRKLLLSAKQEMMTQAKELAMQKLTKLDDKTYRELMMKHLLACAQDGTGAIGIAKDEKRIDAAFLADVNSKLKEKTGKGEVKLLGEPKDITGGFVYFSEGLEINVSLSSLLGEAWQDVETQVAKVLFED
jgi:V/A-type H+-transporting ATPase subunit E